MTTDLGYSPSLAVVDSDSSDSERERDRIGPIRCVTISPVTWSQARLGSLSRRDSDRLWFERGTRTSQRQ